MAAVQSGWPQPLDRRRIAIFLLFAFGIAWAVAAYIYWTGGLVDRSSEDMLWGLPTVLILIAVVYMGAPTFANLLTRLVTREPWDDLWIAWNFRAGWPYWAIAWVLPGILTIVGGAVFFALFPHYFDAEFTGLQAMIEAAGPDAAPPAMSPQAMILVGALQGILLAPLLNGPATFGEEFGWRGYLLQKLMPLGWRRAALWMGLIWGVWHWPILAMGHNYGLEYPGAPWAGMLLFVWFSFCAGTILGWLTLRGRSVWPAVIGHAAINGIAALGALLVIGEPNPLLGPLPVGVVGMIGFSVVGLWMFWRKP
ncbi:MAG: CPBP family intramembrane glutamic endopeptidase [Litorilinea sp.]